MYSNSKNRLKANIFGLPWHGKVEGGVVTFPAGGSRAYPQVGSSNLLLAKTVDLPDRAGNEVDAANGYVWKDRLVLQFGTSGPGAAPATISESQIVYFDDNDRAWLIEITVELSGAYSYRIKATLIRRFGVIRENHPDDFNNVFFTSSYIDLSSFAASHGLSGLWTTNTVSQNPRGDHTFVIANATFTGSINLSNIPAQILDLHITGAVDPTMGTGLSGSVSTYKTVPECVIPKDEETSSFDYKKIIITHSFERNCTPGTPGEGETISTFQTGAPALADDQIPHPDGWTYYDGTQLVTAGLRRILTAFFDEDGVPVVVELERDTETRIVKVIAWTVDKTITLAYDVSGSPPPADSVWDGAGPGTGYTSDQQVSSVETTTTTTQIASLYLNGVIVESIDIETYSYDVDITSLSSAGPVDSTGQFFAPCEHFFESNPWTNFIGTQPGSAADFSYTESFEVKNNDGVIYSELSVPGGYSNSWYHAFSNRVFGILMDPTLATYIGTSRYFGVHTNTDGIQGPTEEYASYNPYDGTLEISNTPIGFV